MLAHNYNLFKKCGFSLAEGVHHIGVSVRKELTVSSFELLGPTKLFHVHVQDTSLNDVSPHCFNQLIQNQVAGMSIQSHLNFRCHIFPISIAAGREV